MRQRGTTMRGTLGAVLIGTVCAMQLAHADDAVVRPTVREIVYEGNEHTRDETMAREIKIAVGDPADPRQIEASRQAILDLGLFKGVRVREEPLPDGGERVVFHVTERF